LALFAVARNAVQRLLTRVVFGRRGTESVILEIRRLRTECTNQQDYLRSAAGQIAKFMEAERVDVAGSVRQEWHDATGPFAPSDFQVWRSAEAFRWVYAVIPVRLASDRIQFIMLGARRGNRRYLSEDFRVLARMAQAISDEIARYESLEMQALISEAELRALQAQINPHFLFNALNTLFGTISRENSEARRLVLNLADVLRHALGSGERYVSLEEEIRIVKAYLEIEQLRLGPKLETKISIDREALPAQVPVLSIQPLVENAVKHGVARNPHKGYVRLTAKKQDGGVHIEIVNSGELVSASNTGSGSGVGLKNVRRRLSLCYGGDLSLTTAAGETIAKFTVPC
jgi:LytS/YehU family sensor histidine kinase